MLRETIAPRKDWQDRVESVGLTYHSGGLDPAIRDGVHWDEAACYRFEADEVDAIEAATEELHRLCLAAVGRVVHDPELMDRFGIPTAYQDYARRSWDRRDPHVMGRFDLAFDPADRAVKMLEYNADTPTLVIETAVVQWFWLQDVRPDADQFNSLHERLIERYRSLVPLMNGEPLYFSGMPESVEEMQHLTYFMDLATQAGVRASFISIHDVGHDTSRNCLVDLEARPIRYWSKLYPWEWLATERFGQFLPADLAGCIEPVWKMVLSNKAILPVLWSMFPGHPNLLPSFFEEGAGPLLAGGDYVAKPILAREGANVRMARADGPELSTGGPYAGMPLVYQARARLPSFDGRHAVIGSWVVGDEAAGMVIREGGSPLVTADDRIVPHYFT